MLKKFLFISIACCLFFKPIQIFAADYDEDDTEIMMNGENPFVDTQFCGFEKFKQWFGLKEKQQIKIDEKNEKNFKNALTSYLNYKFKNEQTFDKALKLSLEGAQNACPKSMELLGTLKVEKGDNAPEEEKQKYYKDAFSWYVISFWMQIIKEVKLKKNVVIPSKIILNLENLTKKSGFCQKRINYFNHLNENKKFVLGLLKYSDKQIFYKYIVRIVHNMHENYLQDCFFADRKFFVFTFNILDWALSLKNELTDNKKNCEKFIQCLEIFLNKLATLFNNNEFLLEASFCYRNPTEENQIFNLAIFIINGQRKTDPFGQKIKEQDRNKVGSSLLWCLKSQENKDILLEYILNDLIKFDKKGKNINKNNKYLILSKLCIEINSEYSLATLSSLIFEGLVKEIDGKLILENKKYNIVADMLRKLKTPAALVNFGILIASGKIKKDISGADIPEGQQYEVAANLFRALKTPDSLANYANLIAEGRISKDINGVDILEGQQYEIAANLYRQCLSQSIVSFEALSQLGIFIYNGKIKKDINGDDIPEGQQYKVAADLFRRSKSRINSLYYLGCMIQKGLIKQDVYGKDIPEGQECEVAADLFREVKNEYGLFALATSIYKKKISTDLDRRSIDSDEQRREIAIKLYLDSGFPEALYNVAIIKLCSPLGKSLEVKKEALTFLMKAALQGIENAAFYYEILKNEIESEEYSLSVSGQCQQSNDSEILEIKKENSFLCDNRENDDLKNEIKDSSGDEDYDHDDLEIDDCHEVQQLASLQLSCNKDTLDTKTSAGTSSDALSEELNLLQRKKLKALKKEQRKQKIKKQVDKFKKFLVGQLSEQDKKSFIQNQKMNISKEDIKITFDKNAQDQWVVLNAFERNKVSELIADIKIGGKRGKPEKLQNSDAFSRRITDKHRLVYKIVNNGNVNILSCQGHYDD